MLWKRNERASLSERTVAVKNERRTVQLAKRRVHTDSVAEEVQLVSLWKIRIPPHHFSVTQSVSRLRQAPQNALVAIDLCSATRIASNDSHQGTSS